MLTHISERAFLYLVKDTFLIFYLKLYGIAMNKTSHNISKPKISCGKQIGPSSIMRLLPDTDQIFT